MIISMLIPRYVTFIIIYVSIEHEILVKSNYQLLQKHLYFVFNYDT